MHAPRSAFSQLTVSVWGSVVACGSGTVVDSVEEVDGVAEDVWLHPAKTGSRNTASSKHSNFEIWFFLYKTMFDVTI